MRIKIWILSALSAFAVLSAQLHVSAEDKAATPAKTAPAAQAPAAPAAGTTAPAATPSPEEAAMAAAMKLASPGEHHKRLEKLVGKWTYTATMWMGPDAKPETSQGTSENSLKFGGRFLKSHVTGTAHGQPFEGMGILGYDNVREEYTDVWIDSMNTGITRGTGQYDATAKLLSMSGTFSCPMTGDREKHFKAAWKFTDANHYKYTMWIIGKDGKEFKTLEIVHKRSAAAPAAPAAKPAAPAAPATAPKS